MRSAITGWAAVALLLAAAAHVAPFVSATAAQQRRVAGMPADAAPVGPPSAAHGKGGAPAPAPALVGPLRPCQQLQEVPLAGGAVACTHGPDPAPPGVDASRPRPLPGDAEMSVPPPPRPTPQPMAGATAVPCYGDGTSGNRVQALYAHPADRPDRYDQVVGLIRQWAAEVDLVVNTSARETGGTRHVRFVTDASCTLVVEKVRLSPAGDDNVALTQTELAAQGFNRSDRRYLVWMDSGVLCGVATYYLDDRPTQDNANNGSPGFPASVARVDSGCWGRLESTGQSLEAHELMHTLGSVLPGAPHASPLGHCSDDADVMCYQDGSPGLVLRSVCAQGAHETFDCNHDDYFHTAPTSGWLATHWNTAASSFLATDEPYAPALPRLEPTAPPATFRRLAGEDRVATALAISGDAFPSGAAGAAVLANFQSFADALPGTPLAVAVRAPLLLTPGGALDRRVRDEIRRVVPPGAPVYVLGGEEVMTPALVDEVRGLGYSVVRYGGANRYETAVQIAERGLASPTTVFEATGLSFADALAGGAAAAAVRGAVLLTSGSRQAVETAAYLAAHPTTRRYALGGPAAAADPLATPLVGDDRYETAVRVAEKFFASPPVVGVGSGLSFPDALAGGGHIGAKESPILLVPPSGEVPSAVEGYLRARADRVAGGWVYGGPSAVGDEVASRLSEAIP